MGTKKAEEINADFDYIIKSLEDVESGLENITECKIGDIDKYLHDDHEIIDGPYPTRRFEGGIANLLQNAIDELYKLEDKLAEATEEGEGGKEKK